MPSRHCELNEFDESCKQHKAQTRYERTPAIAAAKRNACKNKNRKMLKTMGQIGFWPKTCGYDREYQDGHG